MPPSTRNVDAVMKRRVVAREERDGGRELLGLGEPSLRNVHEATLGALGSFANSSCSSGVFTGPGQSALTRMPCRANCTPSSLVIASTPPFDAVYEIWEVAEPITATNDAVLMIEPDCCCTMWRSAAREQR